MAQQDPLLPDLDWLAAAAEPDDAWIGPGPKLVNLQSWMNLLASQGHRTLVAATYGAAETALQHWDTWLLASREFALESIVDGQPPTQQLAAVDRWLKSPTREHEKRALSTVDLTKQLHWFHEEFCDDWFEQPGMWAVEASEYCVFSLSPDPYSKCSVETHATICVACAINSFRKSAQHSVHDALAVVTEGMRRQLEQLD